MSLSISLLPELDLAFGSRRKCLERLPDDECADQPHAQSMKLGQRANHVAQMPVWGATTIRTTELDVALPLNGRSRRRRPSYWPFLTKQRRVMGRRWRACRMKTG